MAGSDVNLMRERVQRARDRAFVGRSAELTSFRSMLSGDDHAPAVLYVYGPGGIGKTMLLRRFAAEARAVGREVLQIDGRITRPTSEAFEKEARTVLTGEHSVLLVDTFERCQVLENWLRERFLPQMPAGVVVVIAGRHAPDAEWTSDPGWVDLVRPMALRNLTSVEATYFLVSRGVPHHAHEALLAFTGGHPLALALAAAVPMEEGGTARWEPGRDVIATLLSRLVGEVPSPLHLRALEVCARVYTTTETLLRAVFGEEAAPMFAWLRSLSFIESAQNGLFPHEVVREALEADLRWRDPEGYAELHRRLSRHLFDRIRTSPQNGTLSAVGSFLYLYRTEPYMSDYNSWRSQGEFRLTTCERADHTAVLALMAEVEEPESVDIARYWLHRQPEAFRVIRTMKDDRIVGVSVWLRLTDPSDGDADPVVAAAWAHARSNAPLRDGEHLAVARFAVTAPQYPKICPVENLHQWRALAEIAQAEGRVAWAYVTVRSMNFWAPYLSSLGMDPLVERPRIGHLTYTLFTCDWRAQSVWAWAEEKTRLLLNRVTGATGSTAPEPLTERGGTSEYIVLSRPDFNTAVREALRTVNRPAEIAANPLCRSRLTAGQDGRALPELLTQAVEDLRAQRNGEKYYGAVATTYLCAGIPTQQAVAQRLGLPFSTYRRHLAAGIEALCDALWHQEIHGPGAAPPPRLRCPRPPTTRGSEPRDTAATVNAAPALLKVSRSEQPWPC
ncbi:ATP-binding protein [Streptomyces sp. NBC_00878]|uniref:ATP-binding protein n=1 Tax=Streptomyces sp. NBC_00878 TaxID=2975854 RepID=UPI002257FDAF|nr:ATP-binding protein [Streptomyces sp. NBC_00878]MCX4904816.1 ATP-binding protein [Streptomyces sp. NBC_00878]